MVRQLKLEYPDKNVIIYHDQDSAVDLEGEEHGHYELEILDIGLISFTKGYETYVFDSGTFERAGDGGFINWSYLGNSVSDGDKVVFSPVQGTTRALSFLPNTNNSLQSKVRRRLLKSHRFRPQLQPALPMPTTEITLSTVNTPMGHNRAVLLTIQTSILETTLVNNRMTTSMSLTVPTTTGNKPDQVSKSANDPV